MKRIIVGLAVAALMSSMAAFANDTSIANINAKSITHKKDIFGTHTKMKGPELAKLMTILPSMISADGESHAKLLRISSPKLDVSIRCAEAEYNLKGELVKIPGGPECTIHVGEHDDESDLFPFEPNPACRQ